MLVTFLDILSSIYFTRYTHNAEGVLSLTPFSPHHSSLTPFPLHRSSYLSAYVLSFTSFPQHHSHTLTLSLTHSLSFFLSLQHHSHTLTLSHTLSLSFSLSLSLSIYLSLSSPKFIYRNEELVVKSYMGLPSLTTLKKNKGKKKLVALNLQKKNQQKNLFLVKTKRNQIHFHITRQHIDTHLAA